jgi:CDP-glucose 4,6-dehydratase
MDALAFFRGRRIFITGHTGFKGCWLALWLLRRGAIVSGYSLDVPTSPSLFETLKLKPEIQHFNGDIRNSDYLASVLKSQRPEVVFHLAAQALVRRGYQHPKETFDVNVGGTVNLLEAVRQTESVRVLICVTSDKCYDPRGREWGHREDDPLGGRDPYSASKAAAEMVASAYRDSFFLSVQGAPKVGLATVRAGNVIGGGDWAEDRLVPDCIRALVAEEPIVVRHPESIRPWQHVLEPLAGYLTLAARLWDKPERYSGAWNFGPGPRSACSVARLVRLITHLWGRGTWKKADRRRTLEPRETTCLRLNSDKAMSLLPWQPHWKIGAALRRTVEWYRAFYGNQSANELRGISERQIQDYEIHGERGFSGRKPLRSVDVPV